MNIQISNEERKRLITSLFAVEVINLLPALLQGRSHSPTIEFYNMLDAMIEEEGKTWTYQM